MLKIGLEVHCYLVTKEKLFCRCPTNYKIAEVKPNTNICPICTAQPGSKPMLPNAEAFHKVIAIALMLGCKINKEVVWQRKHYDWPDLPKGFQDTISGAYSKAIGEEGTFFGIRIRAVHLEEDPARWDPSTGLVDYNRCGLPLAEIVTEPDFVSAKQTREWLNQLLIMLSYIKAVDKDAGIKADINISTTGERVEIKNVNSIYNIERAIGYEAMRQEEQKRKGEWIERETRTFDEAKKITITMRAKEEAEDYRYIPEPDLPILEISKKIVEEIQKGLPEAPSLKIKRFLKQYKIEEKQASVLSSNLEVADFFEKVTEYVDAKIAARWIMIELLRILNYNNKQLHDVDIKAEHFAELLNAVEKKEITELKAKQLLNEFVPKSFSISRKKEISLISKEEIEKLCEGVIKKENKAVVDYKAGKEETLNYLIGKVVEASKRRAESKIVREILLGMIK